jgi:predicted nucleic acid-binding protein
MRLYLDTAPVIYTVEKDFDDFFMEIVSETISLSREVIDRATEIRAQYEFNTPDAIHLAAACVSKCDVFFTNDQWI